MSKFAFAIFATATTILNVADAHPGGLGRPEGQDGSRPEGHPGCGPHGPHGNITNVDLNCTGQEGGHPEGRPGYGPHGPHGNFTDGGRPEGHPGCGPHGPHGNFTNVDINCTGQDGGHPEGPPGFGPHGPPGNFTHVDLNCTAVPDEPECPQGRNGEQFAWVCREGFDRETGEEKTFSTCVNPDHGHSTDSCGCCEDTCPEPCECICDLFEEGDGLGVSVTEDGDETEEHCMDPMHAFHEHSDGYTCNTDCMGSDTDTDTDTAFEIANSGATAVFTQRAFIFSGALLLLVV
jgi:hypothetical protein